MLPTVLEPTPGVNSGWPTVSVAASTLDLPCGASAMPFMMPSASAILPSMVMNWPYTVSPAPGFRLTLVQLPSTSKPEPGALVPMMVWSNFLASANGRRRTHSAYSAALSRRNSSENGSMTASLYGRMLFLLKEWVATGFASVSETQSAAGSPVMVWMSMPGPGIAMRRASCMKADSSSTLPQISELTSAGSSTLEVPRLMSIAVIVYLFRFRRW